MTRERVAIHRETVPTGKLVRVGGNRFILQPPYARYAEIGAEVRPATRWERFVMAVKRVVNRVR